jgi:hypothetical protein
MANGCSGESLLSESGNQLRVVSNQIGKDDLDRVKGF